jgi:hypothetical protein
MRRVRWLKGLLLSKRLSRVLRVVRLQKALSAVFVKTLVAPPLRFFPVKRELIWRPLVESLLHFFNPPKKSLGFLADLCPYSPIKNRVLPWGLTPRAEKQPHLPRTRRNKLGFKS